MATRDTQVRILRAALELFNERGTAAVSTNAIAAHCGISKGNLHYHFRNKRQIVHSLFQCSLDEMSADAAGDHLVPTLEHLAAMFVRHVRLMLKYRFLYREMADLLRHDALLRRRYADSRERRLRQIERFFLTLARVGLMSIPEDARRLRSIVEVTWIVCDNWLNYLDYHDRPLTAEAVLGGYDEVLEVLRPYLRDDPSRIRQASWSMIGRLTSPPAIVAMPTQRSRADTIAPRPRSSAKLGLSG